MKAIYRINQSIVACFSGATFIFARCQDEEMFTHDRRIGDGIPTLGLVGDVSQ